MRAGAACGVVAGVLLLVACGNPAPINTSAANLLLGKPDTGGWAVEVQQLANSFGSKDAAKGVVSPGDGTYIDLTVYVFRSTSDAQTGYGNVRVFLRSGGYTAQGRCGAPGFSTCDVSAGLGMSPSLVGATLEPWFFCGDATTSSRRQSARLATTLGLSHPSRRARSTGLARRPQGVGPMLSLVLWTILWLCVGTALVFWGLAWIVNYHQWADRLAARYRSFWGPLAMFNGSAGYQRFSGIYFIFFGLITYYMAISWFGQHVHTAT